LYNDLVEYCNNGKPNWATSVKQFLYTNGFSDVWLNPCSVDINNFPRVFKQRLTDQFIQTWHAALSDSNVLCTYRLFNSTFEYQLYLDKLPAKYRTVLPKFRLSSHQLRIETVRYGNNRTPQNERYCLTFVYAIVEI